MISAFLVQVVTMALLDSADLFAHPTSARSKKDPCSTLIERVDASQIAANNELINLGGAVGNCKHPRISEIAFN